MSLARQLKLPGRVSQGAKGGGGRRILYWQTNSEEIRAVARSVHSQVITISSNADRFDGHITERQGGRAIPCGAR